MKNSQISNSFVILLSNSRVNFFNDFFNVFLFFSVQNAFIDFEMYFSCL